MGKEGDKQVTEKTLTGKRRIAGRAQAARAEMAAETSDLEAVAMAEEADLVSAGVQEGKTATEVPARPVHKATTRSRASSLNAWQRVIVLRYCYEVYLELCKVTWPTREEAWNMTLVVIAISAVIGIILGLVDLGLTQFVQHVISPH